MPASLQFYQTYGTSPGTDALQGTGGATNDWDFKGDTSPGVYSGSAAERIRAGDYSYDVYVRVRFNQPSSGTQFTSITNVKYYCSLLNLSGYGTGAAIYASGTSTYSTPNDTAKSGTWDPVPTSAASGIDISTATLASGNSGWTDWVALQLKTGAAGASAGFGNFQYFTLVYDEI